MYPCLTDGNQTAKFWYLELSFLKPLSQCSSCASLTSVRQRFLAKMNRLHIDVQIFGRDTLEEESKANLMLTEPSFSGIC